MQPVFPQQHYPLALLHCEPLCTKTPRWNSLDAVSGRGTIAIRVRSTVEADAVMKVNVERAPSRGWEEWAGPPKQWTQSSEGGRRGREWVRTAVSNQLLPCDWLAADLLADRPGRQLETLVKRFWDKLTEQLVGPSTERHLSASLGEGSLSLSLSVSHPCFRSLSALSVNKLLLPVFHISPVYVFNCVNRGRFVLEFLLSSLSVLHPPFLQHTGCMNKNI